MEGTTSADIRLSAVVCTRNRADSLDRCLHSLRTQCDRTDVEVLVVDNGSTDTTPDVLDAHATTFSVLRAVVEPEPGLSRARNTGLAQARGEIVAYLDDDITLCDGWLDAVLDTFESGADGMAGRIILAFERDRPPWLHPGLETWFAGLDLGDVERPLATGEQPFGANMAVLRSVATAAGGFDEALGYRDRQLLGNEETDFFARIGAAGAEVTYQPRAGVLHHIGPERLRLFWVLRRNLAQGRTMALAEHGAGRADASAAMRALGRAGLRGWLGVARRARSSEQPWAEMALTAALKAKQLGYAVQGLGLRLRHARPR